ncbi:methyltransferase [Paenibacillus swuensis]|uniref:Methyltransferase n=1 Tax=Paenibacillus swuensis TaxID=1178515 RepID=A0A172TDW4_9BACL|nr:class I SAM-dependent methyltransferase [Paenibacillus swuensis]ANE45221.1 methyltransferase [Paenibacillus swuensis]
MKESILNYEDLMGMLDHLLRDPKEFWERFYVDREKDVPFFRVAGPDENLVEYFSNGLMPGRVLEMGCGPGRNAIYMAQQGCKVDAIDLSENAIQWAKERSREAAIEIDFHCESVFDFSFNPNSYDFIYDCGLLHHLAPHRRLTYLEFLKKALKPHGHFGLVCFNTAGGKDTSDWEIYRSGSLKGGIGYTEERLRDIFADDFEFVDFRAMKKITQPSEHFGEDFLWVSLMQLKSN